MIFIAFSYSDKNFTVVGNLCFVHIDVKSKNAIYNIPPAIGDRMLIKEFKYPYLSYDDEGNAVAVAFVYTGSINCNAAYDNGYLMFYFPIDSNK